MPKILDKHLWIRLGTCVRVVNLAKTVYPDKLQHEPEVFYCIHVENNSGEEDVEYPILIPENEFNALEHISFEDNRFFKMKPGRVYYEQDESGRNYYCLKLRTKDDCFAVVIPIPQFRRYYELAQTHPESITKKSWLVNLFD